MARIHIWTDDELGHIKGSGAFALAAEFEGTFVEEGGRSDGTMATDTFLSDDVAEEEDRVNRHDPLRRFVPLDEVPSGWASSWDAGSWDKRARPR
ncbi:MAG: hypothetical protein A2655_00800 [Candidatus Yanofskybacteria bacterium RIFCSPHIGHO2_01_FULL_43_42]|uniref:Uncharacterized protein n=1 Tax=Candidatus Yanofskybacteria bacterium RIFCSPLOWO2_01_FULL_43_22 TaxID=1802695 RepID=A0A1F8GJC4_9BACT|nr:MAG: hypothetical protein A2655_00800 [Candidatus Yanofskybacteria bacterium RIFCSPHIGHO2_01_FULL_43_42]OGN13447.1 MAG: hypothetical protein A3D48_01125 [Candidatus Yanofskybacteria bacterium RIFCSPHIGHO2_02_FULL_43_17]OGN24818.1 MAG: hypothetical protein A3A13_04765 [Candidatus Yanofskybacteria bacterium RIFCSPLOWO2_01_FULL_43_22]